MDIFGNNNNNDEFEFNAEEWFKDMNDEIMLNYRSQMKTHLEVGDRVKVSDFSSLSHANGNSLEPLDYDELEFNTTFIVIDTRKKCTYQATHTEYPQDLVIAQPKTKRIYRIGSYHVNLVSQFVLDL